MRTPRPMLVGTAILALLLGTLATAAMAQDDEPSPDPGDFVFVEGRETNQSCAGAACIARQVVSDQRVSGRVDVGLDLGCSDEMTCWMGGELAISNDDGTWHGRWIGFINDDSPGGRSHDIMQWLEGSGAYEGWSYVAVLTDFDRAGTDVRGVLYRGDLPPSVAQGIGPAPE